MNHENLRQEFAARLTELVDSFIDKGLLKSNLFRELEACKLIKFRKK